MRSHDRTVNSSLKAALSFYQRVHVLLASAIPLSRGERGGGREGRGIEECGSTRRGLHRSYTSSKSPCCFESCIRDLLLPSAITGNDDDTDVIFPGSSSSYTCTRASLALLHFFPFLIQREVQGSGCNCERNERVKTRGAIPVYHGRRLLSFVPWYVTRKFNVTTGGGGGHACKR